MKDLAPVVLFCYARPDHTRETIESLAKNVLAIETTLFVFIDYPRNVNDIQPNSEVVALIESLSGFKDVVIIKRDFNYGLAKNITQGISHVLLQFDKVIVLEDDIVTSPFFIEYMNESLDRYASCKNVWHVSGWNYPINSESMPDAFLWRGMNCWGWATWRDRWSHFEKQPKKINDEWTEAMIYKFNLDGNHNFYSQVIANLEGRIDTWAVFWYATIFSNDGLCLSPSVSHVQNIGHDGTGVHCGSDDIYKIKLSLNKVVSWPDEISEHLTALDRIKLFYMQNYPSLIKRIYTRLKKEYSKLKTKIGIRF
jgi:hypothetical protein